MTLKKTNLIESNSLIFFVNPDGVAEVEIRTLDIEEEMDEYEECEC